MASQPFQNHMRDGSERILARFPEELKPEIYAVSLRIWRIDDDARRPYVAIGYNTESQFRRELGRRSNSDPGEIRWNYAFWLLDGFETLGHVPEDPVGSALYWEEVKARGLWYEGGGEEDDLPGDVQDERDAKDDSLGVHFADACIDLARHLHSSGRLAEILGRPVPIVVFDMDCPGWEVEATEAANPPEVVADYLAYFAEETA
ncbi:hypothetical protein [Streptomyces sp. H27-C3]|uniref:hypothetical protein n=1 Tax=Streptomyces sp. H27-C3 TaxID=3046305 RepID=UPI0024B94311|nr:hypothetical protein [Streptomyces sp. H27-C3]MDJ0464417.1 hypothetical protein [Streptomyces sp. H27-C3]